MSPLFLGNAVKYASETIATSTNNRKTTN